MEFFCRGTCSLFPYIKYVVTSTQQHPSFSPFSLLSPTTQPGFLLEAQSSSPQAILRHITETSYCAIKHMLKPLGHSCHYFSLKLHIRPRPAKYCTYFFNFLPGVGESCFLSLIMFGYSVPTPLKFPSSSWLLMHSLAVRNRSPLFTVESFYTSGPERYLYSFF